MYRPFGWELSEILLTTICIAHAIERPALSGWDRSWLRKKISRGLDSHHHSSNALNAARTNPISLVKCLVLKV